MLNCSICLSTFNRSGYLHRSLASIFRQHPPFDYEVIVVDDGPEDDSGYLVCREYPKVQYVRVDRPATWRNPASARNLAYRRATGEIIIAQSDDVVHQKEAIAELVRLLQPGMFVLANVINTNQDGHPVSCHRDWAELVGPEGKARRPLFFLGALYRRDLYAVGGNDEEFVAPNREDIWFADCLMRGLGLTPVYTREVVGHHLDHPRSSNLLALSRPSRALYQKKVALAKVGGIPWCSSGGPWKYEENAPAYSPPAAHAPAAVVGGGFTCKSLIEPGPIQPRRSR